MKAILQLTGVALLGLTLAGCFSGSGGSNAAPRPDPSVDFTQFVKTEIENTDDTREAVNINNQQFSFNDQNNEQAFDELFIQ